MSQCYVQYYSVMMATVNEYLQLFVLCFLGFNFSKFYPKMEDYVSNLLFEWKLQEYVPVFNENQIDFLALENLEETDITKLIPLAGPRTRFKVNWRAWKKDLQNANENRKLSSPDLFNLNNFSGGILSQTCAVLDGNEVNVLEENSALDVFSDTDTESFVDANASSTSKIVLAETNKPVAEENNRVLHILKSSLDGRAILLQGEKQNGVLNASSRRRIAQLIIRYELEDCPKKLVTRGEFTRWSQEIATIFKQESPFVYYTAYIGASNFQTKRNASGKLYEAYVNRRRNLRKGGQHNARPHMQNNLNDFLTFHMPNKQPTN